MPRQTYSVKKADFSPALPLEDAREILTSAMVQNPGHRAIGTTTLGSRFESKDGLVASAVSALQRGEDIRKIWDARKDIGSAAHQMIENTLAGLEDEGLFHGVKSAEGMGMTPEQWQNAMVAAARAQGSFCQWWDRQEFTRHRAEFSMVSDAIRIGGTFDTIAEDQDGNTVLIDVKTKQLTDEDGNQKRVYPSAVYAAQLGLYAYLVEFGRPNKNHDHEDPASLWWLGQRVDRAYVVILDQRSARMQIQHLTREDLDLGYSLGVFFRAACAAQKTLEDRFAPQEAEAEEDPNELDRVLDWARKNGINGNEENDNQEKSSSNGAAIAIGGFPDVRW